MYNTDVLACRRFTLSGAEPILTTPRWRISGKRAAVRDFIHRVHSEAQKSPT